MNSAEVYQVFSHSHYKNLTSNFLSSGLGKRSTLLEWDIICLIIFLTEEISSSASIVRKETKL